MEGRESLNNSCRRVLRQDSIHPLTDRCISAFFGGQRFMEGQIFLKGPVKRPIEKAFCIRFNNGHVKVREESWNEMPFFRNVVSF